MRRRSHSWDDTDEEGIIDAEVVAVAGADLDPDERFDLEIRTVLPDANGAVSRWEYEDLGVAAGCYFRFDYDGSISAPDYDGPVSGTAEFSAAERDEPGPFAAQEHGGMHVVNVDQEHERVEEVRALSLVDQDPAFAQIVLVEGSDSSIPLEEPGTYSRPGGARLKGDEAFGYRFLGEFEIIVTRRVMTEWAERPFIQALEGTFSSAGALEAESPFGHISGSATITDGEFSFDADLCPDYVL